MSINFRSSVLATAIVYATHFAVSASNAVAPSTRNSRISAQRTGPAFRPLSGYDMPRGFGGPFAPSKVQTANRGFIDAKRFPSAKYCQHCHEQSYHEWRESAHANSFRAPFYIKNVNLLINEKGLAYSRHCEGCHNPVALVSGALTRERLGVSRKFDDEGITCMVCHSIQSIQVGAGLGSYVLGIPAVTFDSSGKPITGEVPDDVILERPDLHKKAVMRDIYRTPEFCGTCHKANLPQPLNGYKWIRAFDTWDEWQTSSYSGTSPLTFYGKDTTTCQDCHMPPSEARLSDMGEKEGCIPSHRWVAGNTAIPAYYGFSEQLGKTIKFLRDHKVAIDIFALRSVGNGAAAQPWQAPLGSTNVTVIPGSDIEVAVMIQNIGVGHSLIPEQRDIYETWIQFVAADSDGKLVAQSGNIRKDGTLDPEAHSFTSKLLDGEGQLLDRHEVWERHAVAADVSLQAGRSSIVRYQVHIPASTKGPLSVTATLRYRHFNETFTRFALGNNHKEFPVVDMATQSRLIPLGHDVPSPPSTSDAEEWKRWNNWGIGLLDSQRYLDAVGAFERVGEIKPTGDSIANITMAYYLDRDPENAIRFAQRAADGNPASARASFYGALAKRDLGRYSEATKTLELLAHKYPNSIDIRREYAFALLQSRRNSEARQQYEQVQRIDPDDIAAHYFLSSLYQQNGESSRAEREELTFRDKRDDPRMTAVSVEYLRDHPAEMRESVPWHVHKLN